MPVNLAPLLSKTLISLNRIIRRQTYTWYVAKRYAYSIGTRLIQFSRRNQYANFNCWSNLLKIYALSNERKWRAISRRFIWKNWNRMLETEIIIYCLTSASLRNLNIKWTERKLKLKALKYWQMKCLSKQSNGKVFTYLRQKLPSRLM